MCVFPQELIVYHRESCHLCEQVVASLFQLQKELRYEIEPIDIDNDPRVSAEKRAQYNADVPVVTYRNEVIFYHFFDEIAVRQALAKN